MTLPLSTAMIVPGPLTLKVIAADELVTTRLLLSETAAFTYTTSFRSVTIVVWSAVTTSLEAVVPEVFVGTGFVLQKGSFRIVKYVTSRVTLHDDPPVEKIVARTDPTKYAGGYAIRAKNDPLIRSIQGSRSNVIGLPMEILEPLLRKLERQSPASRKASGKTPLPGYLLV